MCVCTDDFSLLCLRSTKTDKDAPKIILSIGHKPYGPKTIKPERKKNGLPADNDQYRVFDVHEFVSELRTRSPFFFFFFLIIIIIYRICKSVYITCWPIKPTPLSQQST